MNCPVCANKDTKVVDSRLGGEGFSIRRRRLCAKCSFRFSTVEKMEILDLTVIKRDGRRENYNKEKLIRGLRTSLEKRQYLEDDFYKLINEIEKDIQKDAKNEITSKKIGEIVMKQLKSFDQVAYIRYASVYRSFKDVQTFQKELNQLLRKKKIRPRL
ncbi:MAG: transcriptional regulator NrdR [Candidatus Komeilibacteria bacterium RIFOXYC1_FULL_37_11]|uniref:Transcriptional repressor NrdR n=1 Tax=Candidatus Komeilibacteria bacterium RIFOXYC1_FULL_37_11 TaxID=1798555 RepID=A0A1G2BZ16_9BACT|nr:MAG: transcriptional regulator NrdR [Candidatus Komeilibacteria bacterium RIFOXYC1_FULL_37_11]OGY95315.1 MAG: transcriptional regulator NrdR [Candidatus Komeilibacteria bacterium RIFOXYD1_FULL_37_29]OGY96971.1 MAG: transcriptional regulator NrdR [Candidatus Komeilibacteria bacterium RIFOXYD2_FULL_37_8]